MSECRRIADLIGSYIYGDLTPEEMRTVRLHVERCDGCAEELQAQMATIAAIPRETPKLRDDERLRIAWAVRGAIREKESQAFKWLSVKGFAVAIVVCAAFFGGAMYGLKVKPSAPIAKKTPPAIERKAPPAAAVTPKPDEKPSGEPMETESDPPVNWMALDPIHRTVTPTTWRSMIEPRSVFQEPKLTEVPEEDAAATDYTESEIVTVEPLPTVQGPLLIPPIPNIIEQTME